MSAALEELMQEHEAILSAVDILERIAANLENERSANQRDIENLLVYLKDFSDKCHLGKEEDILFPALIGAGVRDWGGPIAAMMDDHHQERKLVHDIETSTVPSMNIPRLAKSAREYAALLREHYRKENQLLFPMAEFMFSEAMLAGIHEKFEQHDEKVISNGRHKQLDAIMSDLEQKYPA